MSNTYSVIARCGFFDTTNGDYNANDLCMPYKNMHSEGVYASENGEPGINLKVVANGNMTVKVKAGQGFFSDKWFSLDADFIFGYITNGGVNPRIDSVFMQINNNNKICKLIYREGEEAVNPTAPTVTATTGVSEYRIANIFVEANATSIADDNIEDLRGTDECPWIRSLIPDTFAKVINVVQSGILKSKDSANLNVNLSNESNLVYYFPEGTHNVAGLKFTNCNSITILAHNATLTHDESGADYFVKFENCTNCKVIGGVLDGKNELTCGISAVNSKKALISNVEITNISNCNTVAAHGILCVGDCSQSKIKDSVIHNICATTTINSSALATAVSVNIEDDNIISKNVTLENLQIYNIGTAGSYLGNGIFINQPPKIVTDEDETVYENESYITIINPNISNCSHHAINVSAFCVDIIGGTINVSSTYAAIEYLYPRNSTIRNVAIINNASNKAGLSLNGGDGIISVENCHFSGPNGNGISLCGDSDVTYSKYKGGANVKISGCDFENINVPIITNSANAVNCDSITIKDCTIGHFKGSSAIRLLPSSFSSIRKLKICDIMFKFGTTETNVNGANKTHYGDSIQSQSIIYLGTAANHVDPTQSLLIDLNALEDDYNEYFVLYSFQAKNVFLGGSPVLSSQIYEYPNLVNMDDTPKKNDDNNESTSEQPFSFSIANNVITVSTTKLPDSAQNLFIDINEFTVPANKEYIIEVTTNEINSNLSIGLYSGSNGVSRIGSEILLNAKNKKATFTLSNEAKAKKLWVKLKAAVEVEETNITFTVKPKLPEIKGMAELEAKLNALEAQISALEQENN